jgi:hypothetical protein
VGPHQTQSVIEIGSDGGLVFPDQATSRDGTIPGAYLSIRYTERLERSGAVVTELRVEATHPKVAGARKGFNLSAFLSHAQERSPFTVKQIVDPSLSPEARTDALRTLLVDICGVRTRLTAETVIGLETPRLEEDPHNPGASFHIRPELLTELGDVVRGYSRRAITAFRLNERLVQFLILEHEGALRGATMIVGPAGLEWPLLDRQGRYVSDETLNETLIDFTQLLVEHKGATLGRVSQVIAQELKQRIAEQEEDGTPLARRAFEQEAFAAYGDYRNYCRDLGQPAVMPVGAPRDAEYQSRDLPDGRVVWMHHNTEQERVNTIKIAGMSHTGNPFSVRLQYPPTIFWKVSSVFDRMLHSHYWPDFGRALYLLRQSERSGIAFDFTPSVDTYPTAVNSLVASIRKGGVGRDVGLGMWRGRDVRMEPHLEMLLDGFVEGRSPFYGAVPSDDPAHNWVFHGMLDEDLRGEIVFVNSLKGSVSLTSTRGGSREARHESLLATFEAFFDDSSGFLAALPGKCLFEVATENLPTGDEVESLGSLNEVALALWKGLTSSGHYHNISSSGYAPWRAVRLPDGAWQLSLDSVHAYRVSLPYLVACTVKDNEVREFSISRGERGPFGGLWGCKITPGPDACGFELNEVVALARAVSDRSIEYGNYHLKSRVLSVCPGAKLSRFANLRAMDPERDSRDLWDRMVSWFKNIW